LLAIPYSQDRASARAASKPFRFSNAMRTDAEVIACSLTSPGSFGELFDRHATTMCRYFVRRVGPEDADSLLGELFAAAVRPFDRRRRRVSTTRSTPTRWRVATWSRRASQGVAAGERARRQSAP
jgi:hypothetical protein